MRQGRSKQQFGAKSRDKGRWSVGIKLCWILNRCCQVCGWIWDKMNYADKNFLDFFQEYDGQAVILADWGFRCVDGVPNNVKLCKKGTWNNRMVVETSFSLLTVVFNPKKFHHRLKPYIQSPLSYTILSSKIFLNTFS